MGNIDSKRKIYFDNLDAIRFFCFLSVFFYHSFATDFEYISDHGFYQFVKWGLFKNGNLGVNVFFVLSGFLITYLLILEKKRNGQISLRSFWIRRILRIWPLFYFCVFFGFVLFPILKGFFGQISTETASLSFYLLFINNFDLISNGFPDSSVLSVLWSVAIEEQFYLIWPIILYALPIKRYWIAFTSIILASLVFRAFNDSYLMHEYHTLSCIGDMAVGAMGAWLISENGKFRNLIMSLSKSKILLIYIGVVGIYFFRFDIMMTSYPIRIFERLIFAFLILLLILEQNFSKHSFFKLSGLKKVSNLGLITYGLYCLHMIGILISSTIVSKMGLDTKLWQVMLLEPILALFITIVISKVSYKYFEQPFLKLKEKFNVLT